jgi:hypothetical protein
VVRRTTVLLPLFATLAIENEGLPLALIELGASAGLNLHWDRFRHVYRFESGQERAWGDPDSPVQLSTRVRSSQLPAFPAELSVAWRVGIDLEPIDPDDEAQWLWLRALVFPEHVERHGELEAAADLARSHPTEVLRGDAVAGVAGLLARAPRHALVCLYATAVLNQLPRDSRRFLWEQLAEASRLRPLHLVTLEGVPEGWARLQILAFVDGERRIRHLADAHAHGRWIRWLGAQAAGS